METEPNTIDILNDGGIMKEILQNGDGGETPPVGSEVSVHYVGTLVEGGDKFDSSRDRDEPFKFKLGQGQVIKGWDEGVATMTKGEKAVFTLQPQYAYGDNGSPPKIPAKAALRFEVELLSWKDPNVEDLSLDEKGGLVKLKITKAGEGWEKADDGAKVVFSYEAKAGEDVWQKAEREEGRIDYEELSEGMERVLRAMKGGEEALVRVSAQYLRDFPTEFPLLSSRLEKEGGEVAEVQMTVQLTELQAEKKSWEMNTEEKLAAGRQAKEDGNATIGRRQYERAVRRYKRGVEVLKADTDFSEEEKAQAQALLLPLYLNIAFCHLNTKSYNRTIENCDLALAIEKENVKGLFRKGKALVGKGEWEEAVKVLSVAASLPETNKSVSLELKKTKILIKRKEKEDAKLYGRMFK